MPTVPTLTPEEEDETTSLMNQGKSRVPAWMGMPPGTMQSTSMLNEAVRSFIEEQGRPKAIKPPTDDTIPGTDVKPIKESELQDYTRTAAQRVFDAHAAFHPADPGRADPTPTDLQMLKSIGQSKLKIPVMGKGIGDMIGQVRDVITVLRRGKLENWAGERLPEDVRLGQLRKVDQMKKAFERNSGQEFNEENLTAWAKRHFGNAL